MKGSEKLNEEGAIETKVDTIDQRSPPGQNQLEPTNERTTVVHLTRKQAHGSGVTGSAAAAVGNALGSARDAVFGKGKDSQPRR